MIEKAIRKNSRIELSGKPWQAHLMNTALLPPPGSLKVFCMAHGISRLRLFGSAAREDFDSERSDVDLLVEYEAGKHPGLDHFRIAEEFSELFGRKVDLNTPAMLGRHLSGISKEAVLLYGDA